MAHAAAARKVEVIAWVVPEQMSDGSTPVHNVVMIDANTRRHIVIGALDKANADHIAKSINDGAAWVELQA